MSEKLLLRGARQLLTLRGPSGPRRGLALRELSIIEDGALLIEDGRITQVGSSRRVENLSEARQAREVDVSGRVVMPGFVDPHTHIVFGPSRLADYEMRLEGRDYAAIAAAGGGILSSMHSVRTWTGARLEHEARRWVRAMALSGTTTLEAKSGYGLDEPSELKLLRVARRLDGSPLHVIPTFLGAHAVPPEYAGRPDAYLDFLSATLLPTIVRRKLARYADVYCDSNAFSTARSRRYLESARDAGLGLRVHASQFANIGAVEMAVDLGVVSADHLEAIEPAQATCLARSNVIATMLPGSVFHLGLSRYAPARMLIDAGAAVALGTDFNPGSSPTPSMPMVLSLACAQMKMTPAEAIVAATVNSAHALEVAARVGTLEAGKLADIVVLNVPDYRELPYYFGANLVEWTIKQGVLLQEQKEEIWHAG